MIQMYENILLYKPIFMMLGGATVIVTGIFSIMAARLYQGNHPRVLTGPLYSTYLYGSVIAVVAGIGEYLMYRANDMSMSDQISMAVGICLLVFSVMVLFTIGGMCFASKCYKKPVASTLKRGPFDNLFR
jgi:hypothetical protein